MATIDPDDKAGKGKKVKKTSDPDRLPFGVTMPRFNPGQVQSLLDFAPEFSRKQVEFSIHEEQRRRVVQVRADSQQRVDYIEFLLDRVTAGQEMVERLYELPTAKKPDGQ